MWVDLGSPDLEASKTFYGKLFGWTAHVTPDPAAGGYTMFKLDGKEVAGLGPLQMPNQPTAWSIYIATDNADASAKAVRGAGGKVIVEPMDVMKSGRMAIFTDPAGAFFGVWQSGDHKGAQVVNQPNSFAWCELSTRDVEGAKAFYQKAFGWGNDSSPMPNGGSYTEWKVNGKSVAGAMHVAEVPPNWMPYFGVNDPDAAAAKALGLGAKTIVPPSDFPGGRFAILSDPQGAAFGILRMQR
jgi:predicted enzyme related to lactoylglutathione lyase